MGRGGKRVWEPAALAGAALAAWGVLLWAPMTFDDHDFVAMNPFLLGPWPGVGAFLRARFAGTYEPPLAMIHWALVHMAGEAPFAYRATSLLLHVANAVLLWRLARRWLASDHAAFAAAILFVLFPAHAETLALTTFKRHLLVTFCALAFLSMRESRLGSLPRWAFCLLLQGLALLCVETGALIPLLAILTGADWRRDKRLFTCLLFLIAGYGAFRLFMMPRELFPAGGGGWGWHLLTSAKCLLWCLSQLLLPARLCLEHSLSPVRGWGEGACVLLAAAAAAAASAWLWRRDRRLGLGTAWVWLCLLPALNLLPIANYSLAPDRYLYLPSLGFCLAMARAAELWLPRRWAGCAVLGLASAYAARGVTYAALFADPLELWTRTAACAPGNPRAHHLLAREYLLRGRYKDAEASYKRILELEPPSAGTFLGLAAVYAETGRLSEAYALSAEVAARDPGQTLAWHQMGLYRLRLGRPAEALEALGRAAELDPTDGGIRFHMGLCELALGRKARADQDFAMAAADPRVRDRAAGALAKLRPADGRGTGWRRGGR